VGSVLGAVILPVAGFTLLRYVPLGRALAETIAATALGGAIGVQFLGAWWLAGPLVGFGVAATRLWALARRARERRWVGVLALAWVLGSHQGHAQNADAQQLTGSGSVVVELRYLGSGRIASLPPPMSGINRLFPSWLMVRSAADSMPLTWISRGFSAGCAAGVASTKTRWPA
jgi:hypothetical protein